MFYSSNNTSNLQTMFATIHGFTVSITLKLYEIELHIHRAIMVIGLEHMDLSLTILV